jgi:CheY-like chemotaxis protein
MTALRKVLVVDDDPVVGASFKRVLSGKGYVVVAAENGLDALAKMEGDKFDAVFTDLRMPGMDGLQVAEKIKASQPWVPVVLVTGYGSAANEARARAAGVVDFLRKPLSPDMIEDSAANAVRTVPTVEPAVVAVAPEAAPATEAQPAPRGGTLKNMLLFLSAPFVGLVYAVLLPFVGLGMVLWFAGQALMKQPKARDAARGAKIALQLVVAPFIGLAYLIALPFAALGMLVWMGAKAAFARTPIE